MFVRRKFDVLALSETKLKGTGECDFGVVNGRKSGVEEGWAREGVVLILSDRLASSVTEWKEVSSRLMWVKVKLGVERWAFVSAYGPGSERSEEEREQFWTDLSECIESFGGQYNVVVLGDLNARVGDVVVENVVGRYGVPGRNDSGENLIGLCMEQELVVGNSLFKKRDIHKYTWVKMAHGAVVERAMMDFVLISRRVVGRLLDVRVLRGEGGGMSDHLLVEGRLRVEQRWKGNKRVGAGREVVKVSELNVESKAEEFQHALREEYDSVRGQGLGSVEEEWETFKDALLRCAKNVCGVRRVGGCRRKGCEWWNEEVKLAVAQKRKAFEQWLQARSAVAYDNYREMRKVVKQVVRRAKRDADARWGRRLCQNFEENKKMFWKEVKMVRKGETGKEEVVKDVNGQLLLESGDVRKRWAEYFDDLLNVEDAREADIVAVEGGARMPVLGERLVADITEEEVREAVEVMKAGKAPGLDGIATECLKKGGVTIVEWLVRLLNLCFVSGMVPIEWRSACIVPLYKGKGDKNECCNSRGISLLCVVGKLYGRVLIKRIRESTDGAIGEEQCGFRSGRGCADQIFAVRQVCEKYLAKGKDVFWAFMDLEKAYDRVDRDALWRVLRLYGVGGNLLKAVQSFYVGSRACVRVGSEVSEWFTVKVGLRQGCVMSPWLFNLFMDGVVREVNASVLGRGLELLEASGQSWQLSQLLFADDTALVADSEEKLCRLVSAFGRVCERRKLRVNVGKSKVMRCSRDVDASRISVRLNGELLEEVQCFKYLGSQVEKIELVETEVKSRVKEGCKVLGALKSVMRCRTLGMEAKRGLYEGVVLPTVLYGAETWGVRAEERRRLNVFEMKCLRSMAGVTLRDRINNDVVRFRTGMVKRLEERVDARVLRWFGHMERMDGKRLAKKVWKAEVSGRRPRGRPKFGWMDGVKQALGRRDMSVEEARVRAMDRREWRMVVNG